MGGTRVAALVAVTLLSIGCAAQRSLGSPKAASSTLDDNAITYEGGDGLSCENAVLIRGASDNFAGVHAEYVWLRKHYPGYKRQKQAHTKPAERHYDELTIKKADGSTITVCFDITEFFGKY